ncbi:MAG: 50S ribosomal protein L29 [Candidatus Thermoplasmatota archaeon]|nr:50S ribosomal protein L29 [Candidatus Thermoplasmatota archaeon]
MSKQERQEKLKSLYETLLRERATHSMGGAPSNPGKIGSIRRQIARIITIEWEDRKK